MMEIPKISDLNPSTCTSRSVKIHYPEFHQYILDNTQLICESWTEKLYWYYNDLKDYPKCPVCGGRLKFLGLHKGYTEFCSNRCVGKSKDIIKRKKETSYKKYGIDNPMSLKEIRDKLRKTTQMRYGVDNVFQLESVKEKIKQTNLEKFGATHHMKTEQYKNKVKQTNIERYGVECISQRDDYKEVIKNINDELYGGTGFKSKSIREKIDKTNLLKYGTIYTSQNDEISKKISLGLRNNIFNHHPRLIKYTEDGDWVMSCPHPECNKCSEKYYITYSSREYDRSVAGLELCTRLSPVKSGLSYLEYFICNILDKNNIEYEKNVVGLIGGRQELDIYIPSKQIAIECNGCYWHSDIYKDPKYHINKYNACKQVGMKLINVWEDWVVNKPHIIESIIVNYSAAKVY